MTYQRVEHIPAGQFKVGKSQNTIFKAYLGTCLGIALYDRTTGIGGLTHVLLPEPPTRTSVKFLEKYASTGIPMFIKELTDLGARVQDLEATLAGGALVGPLSHQDINLDIGGRSAEIALSIFDAYGIKTVKSETGGFFTCTLELDMRTGISHINPSWKDTFQIEKGYKAPTLDDILQTIDQLKPVPQTALKLLRMLQSDEQDLSGIIDELSKDQVLSGQTLKFCNSSFFTGMVKIETLKDAVLLMGEEMLNRSIITAAIKNYYTHSDTSGYSLCKGGLFFHTIGVAALAEEIAKKSGSPSIKIAYTAGLLHDIGKVILDQYVADGAPLLFRKLSQENENFIDAEKKVFGITHCEAGGILAKKWNFSKGLSDVIRLHHTPEKAKENKDIVYIIYLADLLMEKFNTGFDLEKTQTESFEKAMKHLGLKPTDLPELIDSIPIDSFNSSEL